MPIKQVPEFYAKVPEDAIRWVNSERVHMWERKGWKVNAKYGAEYGRFDMVLMIKDGFEPKVKVVGKKEG